MTTTAMAATWPGSSPATGSIRTAADQHRAEREPGRAEGARCEGSGRISDVIAALDYVVNNKDAFNIRVVNMSMASGVRVVRRSAHARRKAGRHGRHRGRGRGGQRRPRLERKRAGEWRPGAGQCTLGAHGRRIQPHGHHRSRRRHDGRVQLAWPEPIDYAAKPDLVAPGVGTESLSVPGSSLLVRLGVFTERHRLEPVVTVSQPDRHQHGPPVVAGTVALMLQANPALTPNAVKAILQYTAQPHADTTPADRRRRLPQRAGRRSSRSTLPHRTPPTPSSADWGAQII